GLGETHGHGVDQTIAVIAGVKPNLSTDGRHAEGIAVATDAGDDAGDQMPRPRVFRVAETQRVETGNRSRAHREDVAQDSADTGPSALIGLDVARMVVALHFENDRQAIADVDDARVLAGALDHPRRLRRQGPQVHLGRLVRAMLVPHGGKDAELRKAWHAADE